MAKNKTLTIYNSDRYFNIHIKDKDELNEAIKVTHLNEGDIELEMDELASKSNRYIIRNKKHYMIFNEKYNNDRLIEKICKHGGRVTFYTDSVLPYYIFKDLSQHPNSEVVYRMRRKFTDKEIDNIALSFIGTKVIIDISVVLPNVNPYDIIRSLHDIKTNVDEVHLTYPRLKKVKPKQRKFYTYDGEGYKLKPKYQIDFADRIRVSLSVWKMYIYILVTQKDFDSVDSVLKDLKKKRKVKI